jgi:fatty acid amide hydrolase 2
MPMRDPLLLLSATRLAALIRGGEVSSAEVVEAHIRHVERVNPALNAVVADRFEAARAEARAADARIGGEALPPFLGVPCSIKESFAVAGMPHTAGLVARAGVLATEDATTVARMRAAGFIALGVTNVSELCMWMESSNRVYGRTSNPYDLRRTPGGSSGGEGAVVGVGGAPVGLGADIGGSIRMPAFFCGVFGHKPSGGLVPNTGQFPLPAGATLRYVTAGPLARRAEDLMPVLRVLAGPDGLDPSCAAMRLGDTDAVDIAAMTVLTVEHDGVRAVSPDLRAAQRRAADALARLGAQVRSAELDRLGRAHEIWAAMVEAGNEGAGCPPDLHGHAGRTFSELLGGGRPIRAGREIVRWALRRSPHTLPALVLALLERVTKLAPRRMRRAIELGQELRAEIEELLGERGVLLYPPHPVPAPGHGRPLLSPFRWAYTGIFNVLEMPVTQVPLGLNAEGVPLGVQVAAAPGNDHLTIGTAQRLEEAFGGWAPPPIPPRR